MAKDYFKTTVGDEGRICTVCGEFKLYSEYSTTPTIRKRVSTGTTAQCKKCRQIKREKTRNAKKDNEKYKERNSKLIAEDILWLKAKRTRTLLLNRSKKYDISIYSNSPTSKEIYEWFKSQKKECYYSKEPLEYTEYTLLGHKSIITIDHKIPLNRGGTNSLDNLCICLRRINSIKGTMTEDEFLSLLELTNNWEDKGKSLFIRLQMGAFQFRKNKKKENRKK